jgi:GAF domain-containing protein
MTDGRVNTGALAALESLNVAKESSLVRFVVAYTQWLLLFFVGGIYFLSPELRERGPWIYVWLLSYIMYLIVLGVLSRTKRKFYETPLFQMTRIQLVALLGSALLFVSGGAESYFWFIYMWPLFALALYFSSWGITWVVYGEVAVFYLLLSLMAAGGVASVNFPPLLTNLSVLFVLMMTLHYLMESIRRNQAADRALKYSELLQQFQSEEDLKRFSQVDLADEVGRLLSDTQIPRLLVEKALEVFNVEAGSLALIHAKTGEIEFQFALDFKRTANANRVMRGFKMSLDKGIAGAVVQSGKAIISNNVQQDTRWYKEIDNITGFTTKSILAVPLIYGDQVIGVIELLNKRDGSLFLEPEKELLRSVASSAAIAIENIRLFNRVQEQMQQERILLQEAEALRKACEVINAPLDLEVVAGRILDELSHIIEYRTASLQLIQGDNRRLLAGRGFDVQTVNLWLLRPISQDPLVGRIVASKKPLILSEPSKEPDWTPMPDVKSWIGLPLVYDQETIGLLTLDYDQPGFYTHDNRDLLIAFASQAAINIQKAHLFGDAQRRIRDLEIVNKIVQIISAKLDTKDLLQTIVSQVADQLNCDHCTIFFPQKENGRLLLVPEITKGSRAKQIGARYFRPGEPDEGLAGWVFRHGESVVLNDAREDRRFAPARAGQDQPRSMLVAPMKVASKTIGVISADKDEFGWFSENDQRLVDALALQAGIAIERNNGLELVQDISSQIIGARKVDETLQQIVCGAIKLATTTTGAIHLISQDGLSVVESFHPPDYDLPEPRIHKKGGVIRQVIETGEVLCIPDTRQDSRANPLLRDRFLSVLAVPLKLKQEVVGVLYLHDKDPHDFTETEVSLLLTLANQAAIAIENARLFQERGERLEMLEALNERLKTVSYEAIDLISTSTYAELSSKAVQAVSGTLRADAALYRLQKNEHDGVMKFEACFPEDFRTRLESIWRRAETPFRPGMEAQHDSMLQMDARSRGERLEGVVLVQRVGTPEEPAEAFTEIDNTILLLLANAIGHTLQKLRLDDLFQPSA